MQLLIYVIMNDVRTHITLLFLALLLMACGERRTDYMVAKVEGKIIDVGDYAVLPDVDEVVAVLNESTALVDSMRAPVYGKASMTLTAYRPESPLSNFAADALLEMARKHTGGCVDVAVTNMGGLRNSIPEGEVTYGHIYNVFPFTNKLAIVTMSGGELLQLFGDIAKVGGEAISGAELVISQEGELLSAKVGGTGIDSSAVYRVATSDYLSQGNDKMYSFANSPADIKQVTLRDIIVEYVELLTDEGRCVESDCDGRIKVATACCDIIKR